MARYAIVCDGCGHVVNVVEWNPQAEPGLKAPPGHSMMLDEPAAAGPGGRRVGEAFEPSPGMVSADAPEES